MSATSRPAAALLEAYIGGTGVAEERGQLHMRRRVSRIELDRTARSGPALRQGRLRPSASGPESGKLAVVESSSPPRRRCVNPSSSRAIPREPRPYSP